MTFWGLCNDLNFILSADIAEISHIWALFTHQNQSFKDSLTIFFKNPKILFLPDIRSKVCCYLILWHRESKTLIFEVAKLHLQWLNIISRIWQSEVKNVVKYPKIHQMSEDFGDFQLLWRISQDWGKIWEIRPLFAKRRLKRTTKREGLL